MAEWKIGCNLDDIGTQTEAVAHTHARTFFIEFVSPEYSLFLFF